MHSSASTHTTTHSAFYDTAVKLYKPIVMEGEGGLVTDDYEYSVMGWCEGCINDDDGSEDGSVLSMPYVSFAKWITNGKAMQCWSDRYAGSPESRDQVTGDFSPESPDQTTGPSKISQLQVATYLLDLTYSLTYSLTHSLTRQTHPLTRTFTHALTHSRTHSLFTRFRHPQVQYFNGEGYETWENIWGVWNGITPRDGEAIRRIGTILRY